MRTFLWKNGGWQSRDLILLESLNLREGALSQKPIEEVNKLTLAKNGCIGSRGLDQPSSKRLCARTGTSKVGGPRDTRTWEKSYLGKPDHHVIGGSDGRDRERGKNQTRPLKNRGGEYRRRVDVAKRGWKTD